MRDLNDQENVRYLATDPFTDAAIAVTAVLTVTKPDGSTSTPAVTNPGLGEYRSSFTLNQVGKWRWVWTISGAIIDVAYGEETVLNPSPALYATLADLKQIRPSPTGNADIDAALLRALNTASRRIDRMCGGRQFWLDKTATARIFRPQGRVAPAQYGEWLLIDDIGDPTGMIVEVGNGTTFTAITNYDTGPENAIAYQTPITKLFRRLMPWTNWTMQPNAQIRVTALWGWPIIPDEVVQATLIMANRLYLRKDSPEGVLGNSEWGVVRVGARDPDVSELLGDLMLPGVG